MDIINLIFINFRIYFREQALKHLTRKVHPISAIKKKSKSSMSWSILHFLKNLNLLALMVRYQMSKIGCEILEISQEKVRFALTNCDVSLANALRRVIIAETPTLAPHLVNIYENTSILHDEFLAQRIGLIPFYSERVDDYKYTWECECSNENIEDCQTCKAYFRLQVHNKQQTFREVTSLDIEPVFEPMQILGSEKKFVAPVEFKAGAQKNKVVGIPIVKLAKNQQINVRFDVEKGIGKMHARWSPVSLATFQPDPEIKIDETAEVSLSQKIQIKESCPAKVFEIHEGIFQAVSPQKCIFCGECQKKAESICMGRLKNYIKVGTKKDRYIFTVESIGSMPAASIVKKAMQVLREKLALLEQKVK